MPMPMTARELGRCEARINMTDGLTVQVWAGPVGRRLVLVNRDDDQIVVTPSQLGELTLLALSVIGRRVADADGG